MGHDRTVGLWTLGAERRRWRCELQIVFTPALLEGELEFSGTACVLSQRSFLGHTEGASVHDVVAPPSSLFCSAGNTWLTRGGTQTRCARCA
jgi:hypothetical protein